MSQENAPKLKICLIGESAVGKTSLIRRFVHDSFDDKYIRTMGTKVTKKELTIEGMVNNGPMDVQLLIWDIVGERSFRQLLQESFFFGTQGVLGTCDLTRENTLSELGNWMDFVMRITDKIPVVFLGNKNDLPGQQVNLKDISNFATRYENSEAYITSAKTGYNVEQAFKTLGQKIIEDSSR